MPPGSSGGHDLPALHQMQPVTRQAGPTRPSTTGSRRYEPYGSSSRGESTVALSGSENSHMRRQSQSTVESGYYPSNEYNYQPPSTAPGAFPYYSTPSSAGAPSQPQASPIVSPSYSQGQYMWHGQPSDMRILPTAAGSRGVLGAGDPPSSSGSDSAPGSSHVMNAEGWAPMPPASTAPQVWDNHPHTSHAHQTHPSMPQQYVQQGEGWQAGFA